MPQKSTVTPELLRAALSHVSSDLARDEWARVGMAIKSEFPDEVGRDLFEQWSATGQAFDAKACRATWRSIKATGGVTVATLLALARQHGFDIAKAGGAAAPDPQRVADQAERVARARAADERKAAAGRKRAAAQASAMWAGASDEGHSPYLARKGVRGHGVRYEPDGTLLVPLRSADGELLNLQRILPTRPADGSTDKLYLAGGRKSGLWHQLGDWPADRAAEFVLVIAEGYATAASVAEATGLATAVAFDADNLAKVAREIRKRHPRAGIVIAGDDDVQTHSRTGRNPGREAAQAAARAVSGLAVFPAPLPEGGSDFNDLAQAEGFDAVGKLILEAVAAHRKSHAVGADAAGAGEAPAEHTDDRFAVNASGVWFTGVDQDGKRRSPQWICSRLEVVALTRGQDGNGWGYLLDFSDPIGRTKQWAMPAGMLAGDGNEYRRVLLHMGLKIDTSPRARNLLTQYLQSRQPQEMATCTDRIGWHGPAFVLPDRTLGDQDERVVFQTDRAMENTFSARGSEIEWRDRVGALCAGNSRLVFGVSCAFAGPLLRPAGMESGGFHLRGESSSGKTTVLKVAASIYGGASFLQRWRTTDNALEAIAAQHSDCVLVLDELAQVDPKAAGTCAYLLANEQSKARATHAAMPRPRLSWRLLFLSAGEIGLADHMAEGLQRSHVGQEVRMADIPADAGVGLGAFEDLHGIDGGSAFAKQLTAQALRFHGAVGLAWLEWLCAMQDTLRARLREIAAAIGNMVPAGSSGQVERVGARFALVGAAGELATAAGLTGWKAGESAAAARKCFQAWLTARGGNGNGEVTAMLRAVRGFLERHGDGRFAMWHRGADDHAPKTLQRAGVRRMLNADGEPIKTDSQHGVEFGDRISASNGEQISFEYFVLAETFRSEICAGFDPQAVCRVLATHGCLATQEKDRFSVSQRLPGIGKARCFHITPKIFELEV